MINHFNRYIRNDLKKKLDLTLEELDFDKGDHNPHILRTLSACGLSTAKDVLCLSKAELLEIPNIGKQSLKNIVEKLDKLGLSFSESFDQISSAERNLVKKIVFETNLKNRVVLDDIDKKIMKLLEKNPYEYIYKIANEVNATFKQCAYRIKKINKYYLLNDKYKKEISGTTNTALFSTPFVGNNNNNIFSKKRTRIEQAKKRRDEILADLEENNVNQNLINKVPGDYQLSKNLNLTIEELELSERTFNCLNKAGIKYVYEIVKLSEREILKLSNMGILSLENLKAEIHNLNLSFSNEILSTPILLSEDQKKVVCRKISEINFSARTYNVLISLGKYLGDIMQITEKEHLKTKNFGRKSLKELKKYLSENNLWLGMTISNWPYENIDKIREQDKENYNKHKATEFENLSDHDLFAKLLEFLYTPLHPNLRVRKDEVIRRRFASQSQNSKYHSETLEEIAKDYNITRERIRQIESSAIKQLKYPEPKIIAEFLIKKEKSRIFDLLSFKTNFISRKRIKQFLWYYNKQEEKDRQICGYLDLCIEVCYGSLTKYLDAHYDCLRSRKLWYNGNNDKEEIDEQIEELNYYLDTLPLPQPLGHFKRLIKIEANLFQDVVDAVILLGNYNYYKGYFYSNTRRHKGRKDYKIGPIISKYVINIHEHIYKKYGNTLITDDQYYNEIEKEKNNGNDLMAGVKLTTKGRAYEAKTAFNRQPMDHLYVKISEGFIPLGNYNHTEEEKNKYLIFENDSQNVEYETEEISTIDENSEEKEISKYDYYRNVIYELLDEYKIMAIRQISNLYVEKTKHNFEYPPNAGQAEHIVRKLLYHNTHFEKISSTFYGLTKNNNQSLLKDDVFFQKLIQTLKNHNQLDTLRYETDLYTLMRFANEPHGYYKLHNYDFEKNICLYFSNQSEEGGLGPLELSSLAYVSQPDKWPVDKKISNEWLQRKSYSNFSMKLKLHAKPKVANQLEYLINKKFNNIVVMSLYADNKKYLSSISANLALRFSPMKMYLSVHSLVAMAAIGLIDAPKNMLGPYKINVLNKEFAEIAKNEMSIKHNPTWSGETGKWLIDKFKSNVNDFFLKDNWINND